MENSFLKNIDQVILDNIENEQFSVVDIADSLSLSRFQLQRKFKKYTGKSVSGYIREFRLKESLNLLEDNHLSVAEVAYKVGFGSPSYFTKCFQEYFGVLPSKVASGGEEVMELVKLEMERFDSEAELRKNASSGNRAKLIYVIAALIVISGAWLYYTPYDGSESVLSGQNPSMLFLPLLTTNAAIDESVIESINGELRDFVEEKTSLSTMYFSFDRSKISSQEQLLNLGVDLEATYIVDLSYSIASSDSMLEIKIHKVSSPQEEYSRQFSTGIADIGGICRGALNEFFDDQKLLLADSKKRPANNRAVNNKFQVAKLYYNLYLNTYFIDDYELSLKTASQAYKEDPDNIEIMILLGRLFAEITLVYQDTARVTAYHDSIKILADKVFEIDPENPKAYQIMGRYEAVRKDWDKAYEYFERALELDSSSVLSLIQIGYRYMANAEPLMSLKYWDLLQKNDPDNEMLAVALRNKAFLYNDIGDINTADSLIDELLKITPENIMHHSLSLWHDIAEGRYEEVRDKVDNFCQGDPECPLGHFYIESYLASGEYDKALPHLEKPYSGFGWFNNRGGNEGECDICLRLVGFVLWRTGQKVKADSILTPYIERLKNLPSRSDVFEYSNRVWDLALAHAAIEEYDKSLDYLLLLEESGPFYANFEWTKEHALFRRLHDYPEYQELIKRIDNRRNSAYHQLYGAAEDVSIQKF